MNQLASPANVRLVRPALKLSASIALLVTLSLTQITRAADYRMEPISDGGPPAELHESIAAALGSEGIRVIKGEKRTVCEIWTTKRWNTLGEFQSTSERLYPFEPGQLIGALRFRRRGSDFRDQDISRGVYTLRYALQPIDGNHEGTSPTRDFLVLVRASDDQTVDAMPVEQLMEASAAAAGSSHPAMLCLQNANGDGQALAQVDGQDWWVLRVTGANADGETLVSRTRCRRSCN